MNTTRLSLCFTLIVLNACSKPDPGHPDHAQLTPNVMMRDIAFRSAALDRDMHYRVILPSSIPPDRRLPVIFLLHGVNGDFRDWSNNTDVAKYAEAGLILVMPQADNSYYMNAASPPADRYEDYIVQDLISGFESTFPAANDRAHRAIVGISMGGFGAIKIALRHPDLFTFAGGLSSAVDAPRRPFSIKRFQQGLAFRSLFGPWGGELRNRNDPFLLLQTANAEQAPYLYLTCGDRESLLPPNREFAALLDKQRLPHEFHIMAGDHDWQQWNQQLPGLFESLLRHLQPDPLKPAL